MRSTPSPARFLKRLLEPVGRSLSTEAARELAGLRADAEARARVHELAEKCNEGTLTPEERSEYDDYVIASQIVAILQAQARTRLAHTS